MLERYETTVKPSFDSYISPTKQHADLIVPRGSENKKAVDVLLQHIKWRLGPKLSPREPQLAAAAR